MTGMEETMRNIQKDGAEVRLMRRGLDAGLAKAAQVLEETKSKYVIYIERALLFSATIIPLHHRISALGNHVQFLFSVFRFVAIKIRISLVIHNAINACAISRGCVI